MVKFVLPTKRLYYDPEDPRIFIIDKYERVLRCGSTGVCALWSATEVNLKTGIKERKVRLVNWQKFHFGWFVETSGRYRKDLLNP